MLDGAGPADVVVVPGPGRRRARPGVPIGATPSVAMRSAVSSAIARTASTCGSSISWTAMKCGPTTFQWTCLSVRCEVGEGVSRSCRIARHLGAVAYVVMPGTVNFAAADFFGAMSTALPSVPRRGKRAATAPSSAGAIVSKISLAPGL